MLHWSRTPGRTFTKEQVRHHAFILPSNRFENELFMYSASHAVLQTLAIGGEFDMTSRGLLFQPVQRIRYCFHAQEHPHKPDRVISEFGGRVHIWVPSSAGTAQ